MTLAAYNGSEALTFSDYVDLETGRTLHAEPGHVYDVAPASGRVVPEFPEPWFTPAPPRTRTFASGGIVTAPASLAGEGTAAEAPGEPGAGEDPEPEVSREF